VAGASSPALHLPDAIDDQSGDVDLTVCTVRIAFAIPAEQCRARSGNLEKVLSHVRFAQIAHHPVTLGIDVRHEVMGHLPRVVAQAYPAVEGYRAQRDRSAVRSLVKHLPKADVVPSVRTLALRLLEGELFFFSS
jgi:hypothetical protein